MTGGKYNKTIVIGAGVSGLAAGYISRLPIYEAQEIPGGICSSYYVYPGSSERIYRTPKNGEAYRFEIGGGHWIFGGDPLILRFIELFTPVNFYQRCSAVYFPDRDLFVPYPIQNNLRYLGRHCAVRVLEEMVQPRDLTGVITMDDWLVACFGPTLYNMFFKPFHELYTAGLYKKIAPQDIYKTPVNLSLVIRGAFDEVMQVGYNTVFVYPKAGLNTLAMKIADCCDIKYGKRVVKIDVISHEVYFEDETSEKYSQVISTVPLNRAIELTGLEVDETPDPYTSVLVVNIGAVKGPRCPTEHWLYIPKSSAGFHRVGFYSNVDRSFLPISGRGVNNRVSIYVEKAYPGGMQPNKEEINWLSQKIIAELQEWGWIQDVEVIDPTWIDVAYTWSWPRSTWRKKSIELLQRHGIYQIGRYGRWTFQGIADSFAEGFIAGSSFVR